ncbi:hypothetical protein GCK72_011689 [Caenorhabditis remanei]|uniref:Uncharacterized protein n=1 Tax=Caenorhabditis remanei TaxID=31234 RepID=E3NAK0_CAERE|nr:hypothetical protein GCK72_011689 [Caenorhabditis remanei]EFO91156.1 hypothetical protein CRE_30140 [Caenorhabditis remanei]KAF1763423.1 hypothetical protein GCK72_011689 [Caenorhabditis remanei]
MLKALALLLVLGALTSGAHQHHDHHRSLQEGNAHFKLDGTQDQDVTHAHLMAQDSDLLEILSRGRRAPGGPRRRHCGTRVAMFVMQVCGQICEPFTAFDIATHCCSQECDADTVKKVCCPSTMLR